MKRTYKIMMITICIFVSAYVVRQGIRAVDLVDAKAPSVAAPTANMGNPPLPQNAKETLALLKKYASDAYDIGKEALFAFMNNRLQRSQQQVGGVAYQPSLYQAEQDFLTNRSPIVNAGLTKFFATLNARRKQPIGMNPYSLQVPVVGVAVAGQGYPGMVTSLGFLKGIEEMQLLDAVSYVGAGSTATWVLARWMNSASSLDDLVNSNVEGIVTAKIMQAVATLTDKSNLTEANIKTYFNDLMTQLTPAGTKVADRAAQEATAFAFYVLFKKIWFGKPVEPIEFYGWLAQMIMFKDLSKLTDCGSKNLVECRQQLTLTPKDVDMFKRAAKPFPIYTAISGDGHGTAQPFMTWEFNPIEVRNVPNGQDVSKSYSMRSFLFGSEFDTGVEKPRIFNYSGSSAPAKYKTTQYYPAEEPLSSLMGMWGSSPTLNVRNLMKAFAQIAVSGSIDLIATGISSATSADVSQSYLNNANAIFKSTINKSVDTAIAAFQEAHPVATQFAGSYQMSVRNPLKGLPEVGSVQSAEVLGFKDCANYYLSGALAMLREGRKMDLLIIFDTNETTSDGGSMFDYFWEDVKALGMDYAWYEETAGENVGNEVCTIYRDKNNKGPRIIVIRYPKTLEGKRLRSQADALASIDTKFAAVRQSVAGLTTTPILGKSIGAEAVTYDDQLNVAKFLAYVNLPIIESELLDVMKEQGGLGLNQDSLDFVTKGEKALEETPEDIADYDLFDVPATGGSGSSTTGGSDSGTAGGSSSGNGSGSGTVATTTLELSLRTLADKLNALQRVLAPARASN